MEFLNSCMMAGMALAKTADGREYAAPGFNHEAHDRWVQAGNCPVVSDSKSWCSSKAGHLEKHRSPLVLPSGPGEIPGGAFLPPKRDDGLRTSGTRYVEWDR